MLLLQLELVLLKALLGEKRAYGSHLQEVQMVKEGGMIRLQFALGDLYLMYLLLFEVKRQDSQQATQKVEQGSSSQRSDRQRASSQPDTPAKGTGTKFVLIDGYSAEEGARLQREKGMTPFTYKADVQARPDATSIKGIAAYMGQSTSIADWNRRIDELRKANGGNYPTNYYQAVVLSGLYNEKVADLTSSRNSFRLHHNSSAI